MKIFKRIDTGSKTHQELAAILGTLPETLPRMLSAGVVLRMLGSKDGVMYSVAPACRAVLYPSGGDHYLGDCIRSLD